MIKLWLPLLNCFQSNRRNRLKEVHSALHTIIKMHIGYNECRVNSGRDEGRSRGRKFFIDWVMPELNLDDECYVPDGQTGSGGGGFSDVFELKSVKKDA